MHALDEDEDNSNIDASTRFKDMIELLSQLCRLSLQGHESKVVKYLTKYALQQILTNLDAVLDSSVTLEILIRAVCLVENRIFIRNSDINED
jgi:hypothetical protein